MTNKSVEDDLRDFVRSEMEDGVTLEEILEKVDVTPEDAFVAAFMVGFVNVDALDAYVREEVFVEDEE